ncbi:MAG: NUDIX domain-containing protein [Pseudomonadota bacterium]|nr:NUDIX domain-containing protein [Pseudomonadota bacterium]
MGEVVVRCQVVEVAAVVVHYGAVLLVKRDDPATAQRWSIPAAPLLWGEHLQDSLEREVLATTGIRIRAGAVIHAYDQVLPELEGRAAEQRVVIEIEADYLGGELQCGAGVVDVAWVSALAITSMMVDEQTLELLTDLGFIDAD